MGRKKQTIGMIDNKKVLNRTFSNRRRGILKKASELSTLCDVEVGVIMFGPKDDEAPEVWPKEPEKLNNVISRYLNTSDKVRRKRVKNLSSFIKNEDTLLSKYASDDNVKSNNNNKFAWDARIDEFSVDQLVGLVNCLDTKIGDVEERIKMMKKSDEVQQSCVSEVQGNMMMMMMPSMGYDDHRFLDLGGQRAAAEDELMMMMNGVDGYNTSSVGVGDFTGLYGMQQGNYEDCYNLTGADQVMRENMKEEAMWINNPSPLTWYCDPLAQLQLQAQAQAQAQIQAQAQAQAQAQVAQAQFYGSHQLLPY